MRITRELYRKDKATPGDDNTIPGDYEDRHAPRPEAVTIAPKDDKKRPPTLSRTTEAWRAMEEK